MTNPLPLHFPPPILSTYNVTSFISFPRWTSCSQLACKRLENLRSALLTNKKAQQIEKSSTFIELGEKRLTSGESSCPEIEDWPVKAENYNLVHQPRKKAGSAFDELLGARGEEI